MYVSHVDLYYMYQCLYVVTFVLVSHKHPIIIQQIMILFSLKKVTIATL